VGETSKRTDQPNQPERITVRDLSRVPRGLFALAGMSGLIAGGFAVSDMSNSFPPMIHFKGTFPTTASKEATEPTARSATDPA